MNTNFLFKHLKFLATATICYGLLLLANYTLDRYTLYIIALIGIYAIATSSLNLTNGYTGLFSLGHAGFMAIGAYISTLLTFPVRLRIAYNLPLLPQFLGGPEFQWPFLPALIMGGLMAAIGALLVGIPVLRLRGHYLSVASLGFMVIVTTLAKGLKDITRGAAGIQAIPHYANLWWIYGWLIITVYVIWRLLDSSYGRAMLAIRESEIAAQAQGINVTYYKIIAFVISAFFAGVAGGLYAHFARSIRPYEFSFSMTFYVVIMLIIGGSGTLLGPIIGATTITALKYALKPIEEGLKIYGLVEVIYAILLIVVMLWWPQGIAGGITFLKVLLLKRKKGGEENVRISAGKADGA